MAYYRQDTVSDRLAMDGKKLMRDRVELPASRLAVMSWDAMKRDLGAFSRGAWEQHGGSESVWNAEAARRRIQSHLGAELKGFQSSVGNVIETAMKQAYRHQLLIDHWILDQVTPPTIKVRPKRNLDSYDPRHRRLRHIGLKPGHRQPAREVFLDEPPSEQPAPDGSPTYATRLEGWLKAWSGSVIGGLALSAAAGGDGDSVESSILSAKAANQDVTNVLKRLIQTQVQVSIADADDAFFQDYGDLIEERVWTTMDDEDVCWICESQEGMNEAEATYDIPAHPNCRCWWRVVPRDFADLAGKFAAPGADPRSMAFHDPETGETQGVIIVSFDGWAQSLTD